MKLTDKVLADIICFTSDSQTEVGGILGSSDNKIIDSFFADGGNLSTRSKYIPNNLLLNDVLNKWYTSGIAFKGLFHSHFYGMDVLSEEDRQYIDKISVAVPIQNYPLYFPIVVFPDVRFIGYEKRTPTSVVRKTDNILIT